jgi:hypothetical protein
VVNEILDAWIEHCTEIIGVNVEHWPDQLRDEIIAGIVSYDGLLFTAGYKKGLAARNNT